MPEPLGPFPTVESVGLEICFSILSKLVYSRPEDGWRQHYVDLDCGVFDVEMALTDEETGFLKRLRTVLIDGPITLRSGREHSDG